MANTDSDFIILIENLFQSSDYNEIQIFHIITDLRTITLLSRSL
jgi:hypothetical protein